MCPVVLLALILSFLLLLLEVSAALSVTFSPSSVLVKEEDVEQVRFTLTDKVPEDGLWDYELRLNDPGIAQVVENSSFSLNTTDFGSSREKDVLELTSSFALKGTFLGHTTLFVTRKRGASSVRRTSSLEPDDAKSSQKLIVNVKRRQTLISNIFIISVATLVSLNYINMGCALDLEVVKSVLKKPVAPCVGFFSQYLFMPLAAYFVGYWFLSDWPFLRLGLFTFGCSPGGGASNMWTVLLKGNLNLSIAMTFISTLSAIGTTTRVPFRSIFTTLVSMTICLGIGLLFQRFFPKLAKVCKRILAPVSIGMIIFIIIFGTYANLYMFKLMNWRIILSAALNVWFGFLIGLLCSLAMRLPLADTIAIAVETGVQNTGISIVLLGFSLNEPDNDIASVVPVAASIMTPIPLTIAMIALKLRKYFGKKHMALEESASNGSKYNPDKVISTSSTATLLNTQVASISGTNGAGDVAECVRRKDQVSYASIGNGSVSVS